MIITFLRRTAATHKTAAPIPMLNSELISNHWETSRPQKDPTAAPRIPMITELKYVPASQSSKPTMVVIAPMPSSVSGWAPIQSVSILISNSYTTYSRVNGYLLSDCTRLKDNAAIEITALFLSARKMQKVMVFDTKSCLTALACGIVCQITFISHKISRLE